MTWDEAWLLFQALRKDPSSQVGAAIAGLDYPWSREAFIMADQFDLLVAVNTEQKERHKNKPYPRPVEVSDNDDVYKSSAPTVSQEVIRAALDRRKPQRPEVSNGG